jgi:hypothetical protein
MLPDRDSRDRLIGAIRALLSGQITLEEFEGRVPARSSDPAIRAMLSDSAWRLFTGRHDDSLADRDRGTVSRWVLFLKTDKPYEWPSLSRREQVAHALASVLTLGLTAKPLRQRIAGQGDAAVWPFLRRADYDAAMRSPAYL